MKRIEDLTDEELANRLGEAHRGREKRGKPGSAGHRNGKNGAAAPNGTPPLNPLGDGGAPTVAEAPKPTETAPAAGDGRDKNGRFAKGWKGGPGNPFGRRVARLRQALLDAVTEQDVKDVVAALITRAKRYDTAAAKLLLSYAIGKPVQAADPDRLDLEEWRLLDSLPTQTELLRALYDTFSAEQAASLLQVVLLSREKEADQFFKRLADDIEDEDSTTLERVVVERKKRLGLGGAGKKRGYG